MSGPHDEKDFRQLDPIGIGSNTTAHDEPVAESRTKPPPDSISSSSDDAEREFDEKHQNKIVQATEEDLGRRQTNATERTDVSETPEPKKRSVWQRVNPLMRNPPPVPEERGVSREYTAGLFSLLTWTWITPLMSVCISRLGDQTKVQY